MNDQHFTVFDTTIGTCAIAWGPRGIHSVQLPMGSEEKTRDLEGVPAFHRGVYDIARTIPPGQTVTYGDIAKRLGGVELSREVGQALGRNPCPIVVPCHRVLAAGNKPGGFSANGGVVTKLKMLEIEGAVVNHTPSLFD